MRHGAVRIRGIEIQPMAARAMLFHAHRLHAGTTRLGLVTVGALHHDVALGRLDALRVEMHVVCEMQAFIFCVRTDIPKVRVIQQEISGAQHAVCYGSAR